jgi:serine/threonine-protein kinase
LEQGRPTAIEFWCRTSPRELAPLDVFQHDRVEPDDPPRDVSGMVLVVLDTRGRLLELEAVPPQTDTKEPANAPDWGPFVAAAGLEMSSLKPAEPAWVPYDYADARAAWIGAFPELPKIPIRIEAAAYRGKPIAFRVVWPWTTPTRQEETEKPPAQRVGDMILLALFVTVLIAGVLIARRNVRVGRGDRRGALRLATFTGAASLASWAIGGTHLSSSDELRLFLVNAGLSLFAGALVAVLYLAIEPFVRRRWPDALVAWSRVLAGQFRDPVVGRDVLIGALTGISWTFISQVKEATAARFGLPPTLNSPTLVSLLGARFGASRTLGFLVFAVFWALAIFFLLFLLRLVLRKEWLAATAVVAMFVALELAKSETPLVDSGFFILAYSSVVFVLTRFGLVAYTTAFFVLNMLTSQPITRHLSAWYAPSGILVIAVVTALAIYGFRTTLEGRPVFKGLLDN